MENFVIIAILVLVIGFGVVYTVKHFKGQGGGCCGGGDYRPKRKRISGVIDRKTFFVEGMHCEHCKNRVEEIVNDMDGVAGKVDLKGGTLTVSYAKEMADDEIKARLERAGYRVTGVCR